MTWSGQVDDQAQIGLWKGQKFFWGLLFDIFVTAFQVGALEACVLAKQGYEVHLYEYRKGSHFQDSMYLLCFFS